MVRGNKHRRFIKHCATAALFSHRLAIGILEGDIAFDNQVCGFRRTFGQSQHLPGVEPPDFTVLNN